MSLNKKKKKIFHGFTILETMLVSTFMLAMSLILYHTFNYVSKSNYSVFNKEVLVRQEAASFSERVIRKLNQSYAGLVNVYPFSDPELKDQTRALAFPYLGEDRNNRSVKLKFENTSGPGLAIEKYFYYQDNTPNITAVTQTVTILSAAMNMNDIVVYYYDRNGEVFGEKNAIYELYAHLEISDPNKKHILKKTRDAPMTSYNDGLNDFIEAAKKQKAYRKITSRCVFMNVSFVQYPVITVQSAFAYGKGRNAAKPMNRDAFEVFMLNFTAMPGV